MGFFRNLAKKLFPTSHREASTLSNPKAWMIEEFGNRADSGIIVNESSALTHLAFWRAVNLLAGSIASQPKHLFRRDGKRKMIDHSHPSHQLIYKQPNSYQNAYQFHYRAVACLLMHGNFFAYIERDRYFNPIGLHIVDPLRIRVELKDARKHFYVGSKKYNSEQFLHIYGLSLDGVQGISPIKYASQSLGIGLAAQKLEATSFGRGMHAGGVIELPEEYGDLLGSTDEEARETMGEIRESLRKNYQDGPDSWHNILLLGTGWKFSQFTMAYELDKLIANKKFGVADVARLFGVPLHKLMDLDKATHSNIEQQGIEYVQDAVLPIVRNIESEYDLKLLSTNEKDHFFKFNLDGLMRADIKSRYEAYSIALGRNAPGFMTVEEIRDLEDLGETESGKLFVPMNMENQK